MAGVPFYLMTGKALGKKLTQITIAFREIPKSFVSLLDCMPKQNRIIFSGGTQKLPQRIL
jgi:glucose-6-phosphate 1-dehydrogenase